MTAVLAVVTIVHGRHDHLLGQLDGLRRQTRTPDLYVVVAMDDPAVAALVDRHAPSGWDVQHRSVAAPDGRLPLAAARNLGMAAAVAAGAGHLVLLDVDCVPGPTLVERYAEVLSSAHASPGPVVVCGDVAYEAAPEDAPRPPAHHPARPELPAREVRVVDDVSLFWSLSFAVTARDATTLGGFDEAYVGYGAEDTDYGQRLRRAGGRLLFAGGAGSVHQYHPTQRPPVQHVADIVTNGAIFAQRWGWWPMEGWLEEFERRGLVHRDAAGGWTLTGA